MRNGKAQPEKANGIFAPRKRNGASSEHASRIERIDRSELREARSGSVMVATRLRNTPIRVLVAVPTRLYRDAIERVLAPVPGVQIVGGVAPAPEVPEAVRRLGPHVLFMDLSAQLIARLEVVARVMRAHREVRVVGMLPVLRSRHVELFLRSGIAGILHGAAGAGEFVRAVVEVAAGRSYVSQGFPQALRALYINQEARSVARARERLSIREEEVLHFAARGFTSRETGERLFISPRTVENHLAELYRKLRLHDNHQLSCAVYRDEESEPPFGEA